MVGGGLHYVAPFLASLLVAIAVEAIRLPGAPSAGLTQLPFHLRITAARAVLARNVTVVNQALDGACNVFRRQMLALAEYRRAAKVFAPTKAAEDSQDECRANERGFGAAFVGKMAADKMEQIAAAIAAIVPAGPMTTRDYGNRHKGLRIITGGGLRTVLQCGRSIDDRVQTSAISLPPCLTSLAFFQLRARPLAPARRTSGTAISWRFPRSAWCVVRQWARPRPFTERTS